MKKCAKEVTHNIAALSTLSAQKYVKLQNYLLSKKRTWTVRFDNRNRIACRVRTHFFRNGILGFSSADPGPGGEEQQPMCMASVGLRNVLEGPKGMALLAPREAPVTIEKEAMLRWCIHSGIYGPRSTVQGVAPTPLRTFQSRDSNIF